MKRIQLVCHMKMRKIKMAVFDSVYFLFMTSASV
jgi:hypothetical protein